MGERKKEVSADDVFDASGHPSEEIEREGNGIRVDQVVQADDRGAEEKDKFLWLLQVVVVVLEGEHGVSRSSSSSSTNGVGVGGRLVKKDDLVPVAFPLEPVDHVSHKSYSRQSPHLVLCRETVARQVPRRLEYYFLDRPSRLALRIHLEELAVVRFTIQLRHGP